jgi:hypothetical protein
MEIDRTRREGGAPPAPDLPHQRVDSPSISMPIRVRSAPARHRELKQQRRPRPPRKPIRWGLIIASLVGVLALGGGALTLYMLPGSIANADVGDCASFDRSATEQPYAVVRCGSPEAVYSVLRVLTDGGSCRDIAGATRSTVQDETNNRREICMGPKDGDPAQAVNVAQPGDCLTGTAGQEKRVPCTDPSATFRIVKRVDDVSNTQVSTTCDGVRDATSVYSWNWDTDDGTGPGVASYQTDAVFCLGPIG